MLPFVIAFPAHLLRFGRNAHVRRLPGPGGAARVFPALRRGQPPEPLRVPRLAFDARTRAPIATSRADVRRKGREFFVHAAAATLLFTCLDALGPRSFGGAAAGTPASHLRPAHLGNKLLAAVLTCATVTTGTAAFGVASCWLAGVRTLDAFDGPLTKSTNVSDFWGCWWNRLVHGVLQRGVYPPLRRRSSSRALATHATCVASGLLHKYVVFLLALPPAAIARRPDGRVECAPRHGAQFCFFAWNGLLMVAEDICSEWKVTAGVKLPAPPILRSMLVFLPALPVAHWFTDEYTRSGFFSHYAVGFQLIVWVS